MKKLIQMYYRFTRIFLFNVPEYLLDPTFTF